MVEMQMHQPRSAQLAWRENTNQEGTTIGHDKKADTQIFFDWNGSVSLIVALFDPNHEGQILPLPSNDVSTPEIISYGRDPPQNGRGENVLTQCKLASFKLGVLCSKSN